MMQIKKSGERCERLGADSSSSEVIPVSSTQSDPAPDHPGKRDETLAFLFLAFVLFPILAILFVGGFGFVVWMQHLIVGPPGS
ncbi:hypothetical protein AVJ23_19155 [Pseudoponticoccus marisrubri]|uniref:Nitrate reductase n=1 Tax=Pseudoponticoccus marisrubri TaxID=1685382 RepID=A0A0W7WEZ5_9RHOB|nr:hypothetical protein AVJ23_19155 [Pseudoponticoccus marisrubri]